MRLMVLGRNLQSVLGREKNLGSRGSQRASSLNSARLGLWGGFSVSTCTDHCPLTDRVNEDDAR